MSVLAEITFTNKEDTRAIVDEVMEYAFESVCSTMGPNGNFVVINQTNRPKVTKDGVSVARAMDFNEARRNLIAKIITEPSIKTDMEVGDGTTTTVFQTYQLYKMFKDRMTFSNLRFLDKMIAEVKNYVSTLIIPGDVNSDHFRSMLMTSSNYEETIVEKVLAIFKEYDKPNITLRRVPALKEDEVILTKEIYFESAFGHDNIATAFQASGYEAKVNTVKVVLVDSQISTIHEDSLSTITNVGYDRTTLLFARGYDVNALQVINGYNSRLGRMAVLPIRLNAQGTLGSAIFSDLADLLGTQPIFDLRAITSEDVRDNGCTLIVRANGISISNDDPLVKERSEAILKNLDERYEGMNIVERQTVIGRELFRRISRLRANNITIQVTGVTDSDAMERYYRYEDVMKAAQTGLRFGVIPGIGYGYMMASKHLKSLPLQYDGELLQLRNDLADLLTYQYTHLTGIKLGDADFGKYLDLVNGILGDEPAYVYDNAAATMIALEGAWATAKTLGKINNVMGRSNQNYQ